MIINYDGCPNNVMIVGDVHNDFRKLSNLINTQKPDLVIQCGDLGYFPKFSHDSRVQGQMELTNNVDIYFCDGNHEDFESLEGKFEIYEQVYYMKRGNVLTVNGKNILFIGGAESIDKDYRIEGYDWFYNESITQEDIYNLPDVNIDIVISHCAPTEFNIPFIKNDISPSRTALSVVLEKYNPCMWYFGHYHYNIHGQFKDTNYIGLNKIPCNKYFDIINIK